MNLKKFSFGAGIAILTFFVIMYGFNVFYPQPKYDNFCDESLYQATTQEQCLSYGGEWIAYPESKDLSVSGYCACSKENLENYEAQNESYSRNIFIVSLILGILVLVAGAFLIKLEFVAGGLMIGGVFTLLYGTTSYWQFAGEILKFVLSLIGLVLLISIAYKFNSWFEKKN
jgi:hypothetical protein